MKLLREQIPHPPTASFFYEVLRAPDYGTPWHFHPELELTLVLESRGHRIVGDNVAQLRQGDMVFVGANLPHVWHQESGAGRAHAIVLQFDAHFLGPKFFALPEAVGVARLFKRAARGLHITGQTRARIETRMIAMEKLAGWSRLLELLTILQLLAESRDLRTIASAGFAPELDHEDEARMARVRAYINENLGGAIERTDAAAAACLSAGAFSRFFKVRTGHSLPEFVTELRLGRACRLLQSENLGVMDVALQCGFRSLSHFNHCFRARMKVPPREYRRRVEGAANP